MGGRAEARHRSRRRGREDAECVCESSAGPGIERACLERLGRGLPKFAVPAGCGRRADSRASIATAIEVGLRISWRHGAVRSNRPRRPAVCDVERRLRLLTRCGNRMSALGVPRGVGGAQRVYHRPAQQGGSASRYLLRRHPWHRIRAVRQHRRGNLEDAHRSTSARTHYWYAGTVRRTSVRAGRLARRAGVGPGRLCLLHVPRLHVSPRFGHRPRDLEDVHDSRSPKDRREELAGQGHAGAGRRRHLGNADARRQAARAVRHDRKRILLAHPGPPTR